MRRVSAILSVVAAAAAVAAGYAYSDAKSVDTYLSLPVERGEIITAVTATGTVNPVFMVEVSSQLSGRVAEVLVNFNDQVRAGQPIGRLDPETYVARVNEAKAALKIAQATVEVQQSALERARAALAAARSEADAAHAQLPGVRAKLDEAERQLQRKQVLGRTGNVSEADLSGTRTQRDTIAADAQVAVDQARMKRQAIDVAAADVRSAEANLHNAEAVVEQKRAELEQRELDLQRTVIRAPTDGIVIKRDVNPGQTVAVTLEAKTLFKIAHALDEMQVEGKIDEADIGRLKIGQKVTFTVDAYPDRSFKGRVTQIRKSPEVTQNVVTYTTVISAPNPEELLFPGMTATLHIVVDESGEVLKVPNQALRFRPKDVPVPEAKPLAERGGRPGTVWIDIGGTPRQVQIVLGRSDETSTELLSPVLQEGQNVVVGVGQRQGGAGPFGIRLGF
jgi:HlyD family secretion protein